MRLRLALVLLGFANAVLAQSTPARVGLFAGLNQAKIDGVGVRDISNHTAGAAGGYLALPLSTEWGLRIGAGYSMKGWERSDPGTNDLAVVRLNYFEIPVLLTYDVAPRERLGAVLLAGPGLSFRMGCNVGIRPAGGTMTTSECSDNATGLTFKSYDLGAIAGGALRMSLGRDQILAGAQYELGLIKIESSSQAKNRALTFSLGMELPIR
jgi:hypothetical protein